MRRFLLLLAALTFPTPALAAQDPTPTPTPTSTPTPTPTPTPTATPTRAPSPARELWQLRFKEARDHLTTGNFAVAAREFVELAKTADDPIDRALALEDASLAQEWAGRNLAFVNRTDLAESGLADKAVDLRSGDEIAGLYTFGVFYGLGTGLWLDALTQPTSTAGGVLPPLLGAGAAIGGVVALDAGRGLRYGVPSAITAGLTIGFEEGLVWSFWNLSQRSSDRWQSGTVASFIWASTTIGAVTGGLLGATVPVTPGRALFVQAGATWGGVLAGTTMGALAADPNSDRPALAAAGLGVTLGMIGSSLAAGEVSPSGARVQLINLGGASGFLLFGGIYLAASDKNTNSHAALGAAALGTAAGLTASWFITRNMRGDTPRSPNATPAAVSDISPAITPVPGGATLGLRGTLF